jgi:eukaryotic-like serine/threonine-protein kinase
VVRVPVGRGCRYVPRQVTQQYRLLGRLETGELAELYRAERDQQSVVIKLFHPRTSEVAYAQAVAETTRLLNLVTHPGVAHVLDIGLVKHRLAVVREDAGRFNLGTALQRLTTKEVLLAPALALTWVVELLELVHQAHEAGVVHGALTPGNVMLTPEGRPAVCDFGALAALNASPMLKKNFGARGRNNYRAPEVTQNEAVSVQSDLYSLGAITYELLTLREPGAATISTRRDLVPAPSRLDRRINSRLDPIVLRAIEAAPSRRFRTCADFANALRDFLSNNGGLPSKEDLKRFTSELFPKEVNPDAMGPVPFAERFRLTEVDGAELEESDERSMVVMARKAFSGGEVDHLAETNQALPAFADFVPEVVPPPRSDRKETEEVAAIEPDVAPKRSIRNLVPMPEPEERDRVSEISWDAPPSVQPIARKVELVQANAAAVMKRVRVMETVDQKPQTHEPLQAQAQAQAPAPVAKPPKSSRSPLITDPDAMAYAMTPADSQPIGEVRIRDEDGKLRRMITEERTLEAARKQRAKMTALAGMFALVGLIIFAAAFWMRANGYLPGGAPKPQRPIPQLPKPVEPRPAPKGAEPVVPVAPKVECYAPPPKKGAALLTIVKKGAVKVELDGELLCDLDKVPVKPGMHKVTITDLKSGLKEDQKIKLNPGANTKLEAFLKGTK